MSKIMQYCRGMQAPPNRPRGILLILHSLAPTPIGMLCYTLLAILFIVGHLLALSISGTAYPASFDENLLYGYANFVIQPLATIANNEITASILTLLAWGALGSLLCLLVAGIANSINNWRGISKDIAVPKEGAAIAHPLRRTTIISVLWRTSIAISVVLFTALLLPVIRFCLASDLRAMEAPTFAEGLLISAQAALVWMAIFHGYVILFRLYLLRTRVFGEILY
jgi:hypothetical protein